MDLDKLDSDFFARQGAYTKHIRRDVYPLIDPNSAALSQEGKIVVVSGAGSGIGAKGIAPAFAQAGARAIVLVGRRRKMLEETAAALRKQNPVVEVVEAAADVSKPHDVDALFSSIKSRFGGADVLVNNAGVMSSPAPMTDSEPEQWFKDFQINTYGTFVMSRAFLKLVGEDKHATIINTSSAASRVVMPGTSSYGISKLTINQLSEYVAVENPNVTCITLDPGTVATEMVPDVFKKFAKDTPELIGGMCCWLCTEQARFLNGRLVSANWPVDELIARKEEIADGQDLKMTLKGRFGADVL